MKLISLFRNKISGDIFLYTNEGFMQFYDYLNFTSDDEYRKLHPRICGFADRCTDNVLEEYEDIERFGTYFDNNQSVTLIYPIIKTIDITTLFKFSENISYINLCKTFILCCKRKKINLTQDNIEYICKFLLENYINYLTLLNK